MRCFKTEIEQMKIALIGYGKMGHAIEQSADVAIEFSMPAVAMDNYRRAFAAGVPVVSGTTGWLEHLPEIKEACKAGQTFFYASNFSLGVNIFFALNKYLAKIMNDFPAYDVRMVETHHVHKLDAPSGTAITLAEGLIDNIERKNKWVEGKEPAEDEIGICSVREGEVPGIHTVIYESDVDTISITHDAKSRMGFALGAVIAAEFTCGKKGFLTMQDMLKF